MVETRVSCVVEVDGSLDPFAAIVATGRKLFFGHYAMMSILPDKVGTVEVIFSPVYRPVTINKIEEELNNAGLIPAGFRALAEVHKTNLAPDDTLPHLTIWRDKKGPLCYCEYYSCVRADGVARLVRVDFGQRDWSNGILIAGIHK